jgi:hypothetical protein
MDKTEKFYSDYDEFLKVITIELNKQGKLSQNWIKGIGLVLGASTLFPILGAFGVVGLGIGGAMTKLLAGKIVLDFLKKFPTSVSKHSETKESERIKKAEVIFNEIIAGRDEYEDYKDEIDELANDLIYGREILY